MITYKFLHRRVASRMHRSVNEWPLAASAPSFTREHVRLLPNVEVNPNRQLSAVMLAPTCIAHFFSLPLVSHLGLLPSSS